jgi:hypothetical protein
MAKNKMVAKALKKPDTLIGTVQFSKTISELDHFIKHKIVG